MYMWFILLIGQSWYLSEKARRVHVTLILMA